MNTIAYIETPADRSAGIPHNVITIDFGIRTDIHTRPEHREELRQTLRNFAEDYLGGDTYGVRFNDEYWGTPVPDEYIAISELAKEALAVQNASNIVGVAQSFAAAMVSLSKHLGSTNEVAKHPITAAWVDKLKSLTGHNWGRDYEFFDLLKQLAKGGTDAETGEEK